MKLECTNCSRPALPVVAADIDGFLARYHQPFTDMAMQFFGRPNQYCTWDGSGDFEDYLGLTQSEFQAAKLAYRQGGFKRWAPSYDRAVRGLKVAQRANIYGRGFELWLTTTRPYLRLDSIDPDTRFWLDHNGIKFDHLLYDENKYLRLHEIVGDRLCLVIDDLPEMIDEAKTVTTNSRMVNRRHNESSPHPKFLDVFTENIIFDAVSLWYQSNGIWPKTVAAQGAFDVV